MNNSIAVWWSNEKSTVNVDVNVFISREKEKNYIEFGIKVKDDIKTPNHFVCVYLPYEISERHIDDNALYYQFRINKLDKIIKDVNENYFLIDGLIKEVIFFDFNLNKQDKLPLIILKNFESYNFNVQKVNVFLKTDMNTNIILQSKTHRNIKVLAEIWRDYIGVNDKNDDILVYHWKDKEIFAKLNYIDKSFKLFVLLFMIVIIIDTINDFLEFIKGLMK